NDEILTRWNLEKILTNRVRGIDSNPYKGVYMQVSSSVLEYKMTKCTSKWTTFFILTYIPNYIQNDL
ncbi:hypothetical protein LDA63_13185, partial [Enterococcus faecium]|nr:hypothetical protein [Enterococcus faecium]